MDRIVSGVRKSHVRWVNAVSWSTVLQVLGGLMVAALHFELVRKSLTYFAVDVDEGFGLSVIRNLSDGNGFRSDGVFGAEPASQFEVAISTGPTVLGPAALAHAAGLDLLLSARLTGIAFYTLTVVILFFLGRRIAGNGGGLLASAVPLMVDTVNETSSPLVGPGVLLGEFAAAGMIAAALLLALRYPGWSGVVLGLAIVTKAIALAAVPGVALVVIVAFWPHGRRKQMLSLLWLALGAAAPLVVYEATKFLVLGSVGYADLLTAYRERAQATLLPSPMMGAKTGRLLDAWFVPAPVVLAALLIAAVAVGFAVALRAARQERLASPLSPGTAERLALAVGGTLVGLGVVGGWMLITYTDPGWLRHPLPGLVVGAASAGAGIVALATRLWRDRLPSARVLGAILGLMVLVLPAAAAYGRHLAADLPGRYGTLTEQRDLAAAIRATGTEEVQGVWGPMLALAALADVPTHSILERVDEDHLVVIDFNTPDHPTDMGRFYMEAVCGEVVVQARAVLCWPKPGADASLRELLADPQSDSKVADADQG